jgi:hypothetical protein
MVDGLYSPQSLRLFMSAHFSHLSSLPPATNRLLTHFLVSMLIGTIAQGY